MLFTTESTHHLEGGRQKSVRCSCTWPPHCPAVDQERSGSEHEVAPSITPMVFCEGGQEARSKEFWIQNP
ncbi:hypothetical protein LEMLEM_LOCUS21859 [Lemmus lemmus]